MKRDQRHRVVHTKEELSTAIQRIREEVSELEPSREMSLVLTKLDEADLWLKKSQIEDEGWSK